MKPYAFLLAGHSHWGKSRTLRALTNGRLFQRTSIGNLSFFIRRMSNDDWEDHYRDFIDSCVEDTSSNLIVAFCPNFEIPERYSIYTLQQLSEHYRVHIFVLSHAYHGSAIITQQEIATMEQFGEVRICDSFNQEAPQRAHAFREYIEEVISR